MEEYFDLSRVQEESRQSIDSQELIRQVEKKIQQSSPIKLSNDKSIVKRRDMYNLFVDEYDSKEKIDYLSFKEQTMIKRLLELRDDHNIFIKNLKTYEQQLLQSIKDLLTRITEQCNSKLVESEKEIRMQLSEIQKNKQLLNQNSNSKIHQSPIKQRQIHYQQLTKNLNELINTIKNYDLFELQEEKTIQSNRFFGKLNFSVTKDSALKYSASKSPLKELDRLLQMQNSGKKQTQTLVSSAPQDLNSFIEILKSKLSSKQESYNQYQIKKESNFDKWHSGFQQQTQRNLMFSFEKQSNIISPTKSYAIEQALSKQSKEFFKLRK